MPDQSPRRCTRCVLPETFPGIRFDETGVCHFCAEAAGLTDQATKRARLKADMTAAIEAAVGERRSQYDCIVAFSGGKDSSYTLVHLVEQYGLNCLAVTIDNGFIANQARENCRTVPESLGVDHIMFTPAAKFMNNMYVTSVTKPEVHTKAAIRRASSMCNSCINLINAYMIRTALQNGTGLIAGGYIGGQVPKDSAIMTLNLQRKKHLDQMAIKRYTTHFGAESARYFGLEATLYDQMEQLTIINPMLTMSISEEEIIARIEPLGWRSPKNTGKNSSNCLLNDLGIAIHQHQHSFHPYVFEISEQVRNRAMTREKAMEKVEKWRDFDSLRWQIDKVGLDLNEIAS